MFAYMSEGMCMRVRVCVCVQLMCVFVCLSSAWMRVCVDVICLCASMYLCASLSGCLSRQLCTFPSFSYTFPDTGQKVRGDGGGGCALNWEKMRLKPCCFRLTTCGETQTTDLSFQV